MLETKDSFFRRDLLLTIPVHIIVQGMLREEQDRKGLDRDSAYLLARLEAVPEDQRSEALRLAILDGGE